MFSDKDLYLIQAYIDKQLNSKQVQLFEIHLKSNAELKEQYEKLNKSINILKSSNSIAKAPRDFTLTYEQVANKNPFWNLFAARLSRGISFAAMGAFVILLVMQMPTQINSRQIIPMLAGAPMMDEVFEESSIEENTLSSVDQKYLTMENIETPIDGEVESLQKNAVQEGFSLQNEAQIIQPNLESGSSARNSDPVPTETSSNFLQFIWQQLQIFINTYKYFISATTALIIVVIFWKISKKYY